MNDCDMYGNQIYRLGETGYGVSITFVQTGIPPGQPFPLFTIFHAGDGFRQSLFSVDLEGFRRPVLLNLFEDRIAELRYPENVIAAPPSHDH